jgi:hypothetical protein
LSGIVEKRKEFDGDTSMVRAVHKASGRVTKLTKLDILLDEYLGDVFSYLNSSGDAFHREGDEQKVPEAVLQAGADIRARFNQQLLKAHEDGCASVQVVAHSLGTVVSYHALSGFGCDPAQADANPYRAARAKVTHLYTIGSPLEKIRFFWPRLAPCGGPIGGPSLRWHNFASWFDPVAGMLRSRSGWGEVTNHRILGGGFIRAHVIYGHSPQFLRTLAHGLTGRYFRFERTPKEKARDWLMLAGETLFAPAIIVVTLVAGAAVMLFTAILVPWALSWILRWFLPPDVWPRITDTFSLIMIGLFALVLFVNPIIRARKVHSLYWRCPAPA